jgi:hypothetical protein
MVRVFVWDGISLVFYVITLICISIFATRLFKREKSAVMRRVRFLSYVSYRQAIPRWIALIRVLVCALCSATVMVSCQHPNYSIYLPNGYEIAKIYGHTFCLVRRSNDGYEIVLYPNVTAFSILGDVVVGKTGESPDSAEENSTPPIEPKGFFVLHTGRRQVWKGLDEARCLEILQAECGIDAIPELRRP